MKNKIPKRNYYVNLVSYAHQAERAKRFIALYGVFSIDPLGIIQGYCENSFSLSFYNNKVRALCLADAKKDLATLRKNNTHSKLKFFIYRLTRIQPKKQRNLTKPEPLIQINMQKRIEGLENNYSKFDFRNVEFTINQPITIQNVGVLNTDKK